jgi:fluoride exporter
MIAFAFIVAAAIGGVLRLLAENHWPPVGPSAFPRATLLVNCLGSFVLGLVLDAGHDLHLLVGTALCGALTTLSGVSLQLHLRVAAGGFGPALTYLFTTLFSCVLCAAVGMQLSHLIF